MGKKAFLAAQGIELPQTIVTSVNLSIYTTVSLLRPLNASWILMTDRYSVVKVIRSQPPALLARSLTVAILPELCLLVHIILSVLQVDGVEKGKKWPHHVVLSFPRAHLIPHIPTKSTQPRLRVREPAEALLGLELRDQRLELLQLRVSRPKRSYVP